MARTWISAICAQLPWPRRYGLVSRPSVIDNNCMKNASDGSKELWPNTESQNMAKLPSPTFCPTRLPGALDVSEV